MVVTILGATVLLLSLNQKGAKISLYCKNSSQTVSDALGFNKLKQNLGLLSNYYCDLF